MGSLAINGVLVARKIKARGPGLGWKLHNYLRRGFLKTWFGIKVIVPLARLLGIMTIHSTLEGVLIRANGERINYGLLDCRLVTTAFVNYMVDQMQVETSTWGDFKYHDSGVGVTAADVGDVDIETTDGESRATGNQGEGASANIYKSIGTITYTTTKAITEHGIFNAATGVTLLDRHTFAAINVVNTDSIQFTYQLTCTAGG